MSGTKVRRLSEDLAVKNRIEIADLPFIKRINDQIFFWSVSPCGDHVKDCEKGREYGALALKHMVEADFAPLLIWCITDMPRRKDFSGIEVGFLEFFAEMAVSNFASYYTELGKLSS